MKLTRFTDYAFRVLIYAGVRGPDLVAIKDVADAFGIPKAHIMKVVFELGQGGYLETMRGRGGGFRLAKAPEEISLGAVARYTEGEFHLVECMGADGGCVITPACRLKPVLAEALHAFISVLDGYTLADLLIPENALRGLLKAG